MHSRLFFPLAVLVSGALASPAWRGKLVRRQDGPVDPNTAADCTWYDTAYDSSFDCQYFTDSWGLTQAEFIDYNPSAGEDCSNIKVGNSYCVEVNNGLPRPTTRTTATTAAATPAPTSTGPEKPSPTQEGLIDSCVKFHKAVAGDTCNKIIGLYAGVTFADFYKWNPAVGPECSGLWAETYYCVGVPGSPTGAPTTTAAPAPTGPAKPSPTQDGLIESCTSFYKAVAGDTCDKIVRSYGTFSLADFYKWNPAVGTSCSGLWAETYYCVGISGTPTAPPTTTAAPAPTGPVKPSPTQDGLIGSCTNFYKAVAGDTCDKIVRSYGTFSLADFYKWNPAVGTTCSGLWAETYYCVGVPGTPGSPPATTTAAPQPTTPACNPSAPSPTQPSIVCGCNRWHLVGSGNTCDSITRQYGISLGNFVSWNPSVGSDCRSMWLDYYVCVGR